MAKKKDKGGDDDKENYKLEHKQLGFWEICWLILQCLCIKYQTNIWYILIHIFNFQLSNNEETCWLAQGFAEFERFREEELTGSRETPLDLFCDEKGL